MNSCSSSARGYGDKHVRHVLSLQVEAGETQDVRCSDGVVPVSCSDRTTTIVYELGDGTRDDGDEQDKA
jgi:hypothetical protein